MSRMKVLGAVNILVAFPPLANAIVISLYASNAREEAEVRGWPSEVYEFISNLRRSVGYDVISEVLSRISSNPDFVEHVGLMIYHDLLGRSELAVSAFNYVSTLEDVGFGLAPHITCLDQSYVERLLDLSGGSISDLRVLDLAFIVKVKSEYGEELGEDVGERFDSYVCSPSWIIKVKERISKAVRVGNGEESKLASQALIELMRSNRRLYAYLRLAYTHGVKIAWENRVLVKVLPGSLESLKPFINIATEDSIPAINYALRSIVLNTMDSVEKAFLGDSEGEVNAIPLEALPTLYISRPGGTFIVKLRDPGDVDLAKLIATRLNLKAIAEGEYIKIKAGD